MKLNKLEEASNSKLPFSRILLKLSGEALQDKSGASFLSAKTIERIVLEIIPAIASGLQVAIVVGGGNLFRGETLSQTGIGRISADQMGMLGTIINAMALRDIFEKNGQVARVMSSIPMSGVVDHYDRRKALHHLNAHRVVIFAGGTGNPLVTTDSAASLRAIEVEADLLAKASNVDGIYDSDPHLPGDHHRYETVSYKEAVIRELKVMDLGAFCQCRDHNLPIRVFNINEPGAISRLLNGESEGTLVFNEEGE
jgi:uridylate kinase